MIKHSVLPLNFPLIFDSNVDYDSLDNAEFDRFSFDEKAKIMIIMAMKIIKMIIKSEKMYKTSKNNLQEGSDQNYNQK